MANKNNNKKMIISQSTYLTVVEHSQITAKVIVVRTVVPVVCYNTRIPCHEHHSTWQRVHRDLCWQTDGSSMTLPPILVTVLPVTEAENSKTWLHDQSKMLTSVNNINSRHNSQMHKSILLAKAENGW